MIIENAEIAKAEANAKVIADMDKAQAYGSKSREEES
jgi:hypothetical protein